MFDAGGVIIGYMLGFASMLVSDHYQLLVKASKGVSLPMSSLSRQSDYSISSHTYFPNEIGLHLTVE